MSFGAEVLPQGGVRFALWAPSARRVELALEAGATIETAPDADGWVRLEVAHAGAGTRYRYRVDGERLVPDPASRFQPEDVHGPSEVIDAEAFEWTDGGWRGRAWESLVFYELHVGTFTPEGTLTAAAARLDDLADLGVTAVELMPLSDFPGRWGWGYDGVLPFAPESRYGRPETLKSFVQACHARGLAVFLDVVYNHFGPEGNYLGLYAPQFFDPGRQTPWGAAINFGGEGSRWVRAFFRENALYWLEEYHLDGLRLDAVHTIHDVSAVHILDEIAAAVRSGPGASRAVHLVLENDANEVRFLRAGADGRQLYGAQWNDDVHHALHVLATGERDGYYADYADPVGALARCLTEGFAYQGEYSPYRGAPRGSPTAGVPLAAFVAFLQNHDQIGNRAFGERLHALAPEAAVEAVTALVLLAPSPPLLFMGEEWHASSPFLFFCDFGPDLGPSVTEGRRREFERFPRFRDPATREQIPDPLDVETVRRSTLDWAELGRPAHRARRDWTRRLLRLRQQEIVPLLADGPVRTEANRLGEAGLTVDWTWPGGRTLRLFANLSPAALDAPVPEGAGRCLFATTSAGASRREVGGWHTSYYLSE
jgi:maltooligosyltrehalose trehalohydrolase